MAKTKSSDDWIESAVHHPGALRRALGVKDGRDIPQAKLDKATHSKDRHIAAEANLAEELEQFRRKRKS